MFVRKLLAWFTEKPRRNSTSHRFGQSSADIYRDGQSRATETPSVVWKLWHVNPAYASTPPIPNLVTDRSLGDQNVGRLQIDTCFVERKL
jgi:hypothetical protein